MTTDRIEDRIEALAEAWASMDGKLERFREDKKSPITTPDGRPDGTYAGYMAEAASLEGRLHRRGWKIARIDDDRDASALERATVGASDG